MAERLTKRQTVCAAIIYQAKLSQAMERTMRVMPNFRGVQMITWAARAAWLEMDSQDGSLWFPVGFLLVSLVKHMKNKQHTHTDTPTAAFWTFCL